MSVLAQRTTELGEFGTEPLWLIVAKVVAVFGFLVGMTLFTIFAERRVVARMQQRVGPNRVGPGGMLQSLADGMKLAFKEDLVPALADKPVYFLAPIIAAIPAFLAFAVIPFGPTVSVFGHETPLQLTDLPVGVLFVLACASMGVYGIVLAGWASGSVYPLLGGLRSAAQMISYEVALGLSLVAVFLFAGSLSTSEIVAEQTRVWYIVVLFPSFVIYAISAVGETNRAPFDLAEAESELVGGFHTEYSSLKFAMFFLAEYINMVTVSALATTLFLGGWRPPPPLSLFDWADEGFVPVIWFTLKVLACLFMFIWLRGTLPRLRYDQFMHFGWKVLVPFALGWILAVATLTTVLRESELETRQVLLYLGIPAALALLAVAFWPQRSDDSDESQPVGGRGGTAGAEGVAGEREQAPSFPVPPMDLVVPPSPRVRAGVAAGSAPAATVPAGRAAAAGTATSTGTATAEEEPRA